MKRKKIQDIFTIVLFIFILAIPLAKINLVNGKISETEKRKLATFPSLHDENGNLSLGSFRTGFESWLNDNIGYREDFVKLHSDLSLKVFNTSPSSQVEIGKDGWYFFTPNYNRAIADGNYPLDEGLLKNIGSSQQKISDYYKEKGMEYIIVLPPSKVSIYPEKIASDQYEVTQTPVDILADYLEKNTSVKVIRLKEALLEAKKNDQVYYKTDTHWNQQGVYVAYNKIINDMKDYGIINNNPIDVTFQDAFYQGEFAAMMGNLNALAPEKTKNSVIANPAAKRIESGDIINQVEAIKQSYGVYNPSYIYQNDKLVNGKKAVMFGDSMFGSWNATELLAENFSEFTYMWSYDMQPELVDLMKPDVVLYDITERFINMLTNYSQNIYLNKMRTANAEIIAVEAPKEIDRKKKYNINITVKNTSDGDWSNDDNIRLAIFQDGEDKGYRLKIPQDVKIKEGESYTFTLNDFQAPQNDTTFLEFQMVQEGVMFFGEKSRVDIIVK